MNANKILAELRSATLAVKNKESLISPDGLLEYLNDLERDIPENPILIEAKYKAEMDANLAQYKAQNDSNLEMFKSIIISGQSALKSCIILNGGAAVALLAFLGKIWSSNNLSANGLVHGLGTFVVGVFLGGSAAGFTYLSQLYYGHDNKNGKYFHGASIVLGLMSLLAFLIGAWCAYGSFAERFIPKS